MQLIPELAAMVATMTAQMAKQRKRSLRPASDHESRMVCMYRGQDGCMCAVGALIPDELYDPKIEVSVSRMFNWTYDVIEIARVSDDAKPRVEPSAKVARYLSGLAPSLSHQHLLLFLALCQRFHDSEVTDEGQYSYESVLVAAPDDISNEDLQKQLTERLTRFLLSAYPDHHEFWVKP